MMTRAIFILSLLMSVLCKPQAQVMMLFSSDSLFNITSPLDVDSLFYWFAADVGVTDSLGGAIATNEGVGTWNDLSGNGYHVTQTTNGARPVYKATGGPGSKPTIQFDGSNDFLASAAHWWGSDDLTVFVVMKFGNATRDAADTYISKNYATGDNRQYIFRGENAAVSYIIRALIFQSGTATPSNTYSSSITKSTTWKIIGLTSDGAGSPQWYDDGATSTTSVSGAGNHTIYNTPTSLFSIGCNRAGDTPDGFLLGSISEIIVFSRALAATERAAIELYLNRKYDLY